MRNFSMVVFLEVWNNVRIFAKATEINIYDYETRFFD